MFQHGLGADRRQVIGLIGSLPGHSLLCADAPSHHESDLAPELHSFDAMADCVLAMMDREGIDRACVGGLSMGSGIALNLATRHPERVRALVLLRPAWLDRSQPENLGVIARLGEWVLSEGPERARERLEADDEYIDMRERVPGAAESIVSALARCREPEQGSVLRDMVGDAPFGQIEALGSIDVPTLVLGCESDPLHPVSMARALGEAIPGAELEITPERYVFPREHAAAVLDSVSGFVDRVSRRT